MAVSCKHADKAALEQIAGAALAALHRGSTEEDAKQGVQIAVQRLKAVLSMSDNA